VVADIRGAYTGQVERWWIKATTMTANTVPGARRIVTGARTIVAQIPSGSRIRWRWTAIGD